MNSEDYVELMKMRALRDISRKIDSQSAMLRDLENQSKQRGWLFDFSSNIAGNAAWSGLLALLRLLRK